MTILSFSEVRTILFWKLSSWTDSIVLDYSSLKWGKLPIRPFFNRIANLVYKITQTIFYDLGMEISDCRKMSWGLNFLVNLLTSRFYKCFKTYEILSFQRAPMRFPSWPTPKKKLKLANVDWNISCNMDGSTILSYTR